MDNEKVSSEELYKEYSQIPKKERPVVFNEVFGDLKNHKEKELWILEPGTGVGKLTTLFLQNFSENSDQKIRYVGIEINSEMNRIFKRDIEKEISKLKESWELKVCRNVDEFASFLKEAETYDSHLMILVEDDFFKSENDFRVNGDYRKFDFIVLSFFINWLDRRWREGVLKSMEMIKEGGKISLVTGGGELFAFHRGSGEVIDLKNWDEGKKQLWKFQLDLKKKLIKDGQGNFKQLTPSDPRPILETFLINNFLIKNDFGKRVEWSRSFIEGNNRAAYEFLLTKDPFKYFDENTSKELCKEEYKMHLDKCLNDIVLSENGSDKKIKWRVFYDIFLLAK